MTVLLRSLPVLSVFALASLALPPSEGSARPAPSKDEWTRPAALQAGDTIAFVAPAGPADPDKVRAAKERFERMGFRVRVPATLTGRRDRYLAGSDDDRAAELNAAIKDKSVQAVFAVRGG